MSRSLTNAAQGGSRALHLYAGSEAISRVALLRTHSRTYVVSIFSLPNAKFSSSPDADLREAWRGFCNIIPHSHDRFHTKMHILPRTIFQRRYSPLQNPCQRGCLLQFIVTCAILVSHTSLTISTSKKKFTYKPRPGAAMSKTVIAGTLKHHLAFLPAIPFHLSENKRRHGFARAQAAPDNTRAVQGIIDGDHYAIRFHHPIGHFTILVRILAQALRGCSCFFAYTPLQVWLRWHALFLVRARAFLF